MPEFEKNQLEVGLKQRHKPCGLNPSEIMTLIIYFHQLRFRDFKTYYTQYVHKHLRTAFPQLVSYNCFVELMPSVLLPLCFFVHCYQKTETMTPGLEGKLFGDRGYISQMLFNTLYQRGLRLVTKIKKNMKNKLMPLIDKLLLRKRAIVETVFDQLKNISQIEHSRHRSINNFMVNLVGGLAAYILQPKKPSLNLQPVLLIND